MGQTVFEKMSWKWNHNIGEVPWFFHLMVVKKANRLHNCRSKNLCSQEAYLSCCLPSPQPSFSAKSDWCLFCLITPDEGPHYFTLSNLESDMSVKFTLSACRCLASQMLIEGFVWSVGMHWGRPPPTTSSPSSSSWSPPPPPSPSPSPSLSFW